MFVVFQRLLESQLEIQTRNAEELQLALERLRRESVNERRQRAMAAFSVAENIAVEREGLTRSFYSFFFFFFVLFFLCCLWPCFVLSFCFLSLRVRAAF